ncbi:MAG: DUF711 family protein [Terriglobia bacterium]
MIPVFHWPGFYAWRFLGRRLKSVLGCGLLLLAFAGGAAAGAEAEQKPKVRAVTAFIALDRQHYQNQISETMQVLRRAKAEFEKAGYDVESLRITTQPFPEYIRGLSREEALDFFRAYDALAAKESFEPNLGPAVMHDSDDAARLELLGQILASTKLAASAIVADEDGIHWNSIRATAKMLKDVAEHSPHSQGNFQFAATAMLKPYTPFFPGSYHTGPGRKFAIALEGANVVEEAFREHRGDAPAAGAALERALGSHATAIEQAARRVEKESGWEYMGIDPTPAPLREVSIAAAIEAFTGAPFGSSGTLTAAAIITAAVRAVPVKHIGYSGLMVPVLEDNLLARRWSEGKYNIDSALAYSAVCGTGLDTIPLPGDVTEDQLARILGDMASLAYKWGKPLSARLLPVRGKKAGERTEFDDPFLENALIQPLP